MTTAKNAWNNETFKTVVAIVLVIAVILGLFLGLEFGLHTSTPALTVVSSSMSIPFDFELGPSYQWSYFLLTLEYPFDRTLNVGDIIIIQGVNPNSLNTNYPNSNIIVFHDPEPGEYNTLIVHRIVSAETYNGQLYFITKGDGNGNPWPEKPQSGFDAWDGNSPPGVPASMVVGKVVMRIPWFGWITIFVRDNPWGIPAIIIIIMLIAIIEFVLPALREKKPQQDSQEDLNSQTRNSLIE